MREVVLEMIKEIPVLKAIKVIKKITAGYSFDEKYLLEDVNGEKYLLRVSAEELTELKKQEAEMIKEISSVDFNTQKLLQSGVFKKSRGYYLLFTWVEGTVLSGIIDELEISEQYNIGKKAGEFLKAVHSLSVKENHKPKNKKIPKKLIQLERYEQSDLRIPDDESVIHYIKENIDKICQYPPTYEHGDFHLGNLLYTPDKELGVIDFDRCECGDRYEEFYKTQIFDVERSVPFSVGLLNGYFMGPPPIEFWEANAVYIAHTSLHSIKWVEEYGENKIREMKKRAYYNFEAYDGFKRIIPKWYKDCYEC